MKLGFESYEILKGIAICPKKNKKMRGELGFESYEFLKGIAICPKETRGVKEKGK